MYNISSNHTTQLSMMPLVLNILCPHQPRRKLYYKTQNRCSYESAYMYVVHNQVAYKLARPAAWRRTTWIPDGAMRSVYMTKCDDHNDVKNNMTGILVQLDSLQLHCQSYSSFSCLLCEMKCDKWPEYADWRHLRIIWIAIKY